MNLFAELRHTERAYYFEWLFIVEFRIMVDFRLT